MIHTEFKPFSELTLNEFHDIIQLRIEVFVVEQDCPYQDLDGKDKKCYHMICRNGPGDLVGTLRILPAGLAYKEIAIGRVVLNQSVRGANQGHSIMKKAMKFIAEEFGESAIRISAQKHLEKFYASHQFKSTGKEYLEDGIPHIEMLYEPFI